MFYKNFLKGLVLVFLLAFLVACGGDTEEAESTDDTSSDDATEETDAEETEDEEVADESDGGGELRVAFSAQPPVLDPQVDTAIITAEIMGHVFEQLVTTDSDYNIVPMLAESFEQSDDGLTITFHLREGVLFHNGEEMVAEDVVASMNRWKDGPGGRGQFGDAVFEEVDEYTVDLVMEEPISTALVAMSQGTSSFAAVMPKEEIDNADATSVENYIGTGPFQFEEWSQDQHVKLTKFDDYQPLDDPADGLSGKKEALVDEVYFEFVTDPSTRVAGIQSGEYDIAHEVPYDNVEQLESDENIDNQILPGAGSLILFMNKYEGRFFNDVKAREGLLALIDMEEMLHGAFTNEDFYTPNHNMMMPHQEELWYSDVGKDRYNINDQELAKELFEEAGYDGETLKILTSRDYEYQYNAAVILQQSLEAIGVEVELEVFDWATHLDYMADDNMYDYDMNMIWLGYKPEPAAHHFLATGISGWTDSPELDELTSKFVNQPTLEDAIPIYDELHDWFYTYILAIKIGDYNRIDATRTYVDNYQYHNRMILRNVSNNI